MNDNYKNITITAEHIDVRIDRWYRMLYKQASQSTIEKLLRTKNITVNKKIVKSNYRLKENDVIRYLNIPQEVQSKKTINYNFLKLIKEHVIYQDQYIAVINKPAGIAVQGGSKINNSIDDILSELFSENARLIHRIDKETSGILMIALTYKVAKELTLMFKNREIKKIYYAIVNGVIKNKKGKIEYNIEKNNIDQYSDKMIASESNGKNAVTFYNLDKIIKNKFSLIKVIPETGRKHQIRIHMQAIGHPIVNDLKYGSKKLGNKMFLHAQNISFNYLNKKYNINANLPKYFNEFDNF